jgi:hypothetical protein
MNTFRVISRTIAATAFLAAGCETAAAQSGRDTTTVTPRWTTGSFRIEFGADRLGITALNKTMSTSGRPQFDDQLATIGISGSARYGRVLVGGTGETALPQRNLSAGWINKLWYGTASAELGLVALETPMFVVYPQASIGVRHRVLRMEQAGDFSYDVAVTNPTRGVSMSTWRAIAGYGVVAEWRLATRITGPMSLGVRGGYATPLGGGHTTSGESTVSDTPGEGSGGYVRFSVGKPLGKRRNVASVLSSVLVPLVVR